VPQVQLVKLQIQAALHPLGGQLGAVGNWS
jgi:hypothetical protein